MNSSNRKYEKMRPDQIIAERDKKSVVYVPIGPLEWHGPALPMGTDPLAAEAIAIGIAEKIGGVVLPTLYLGTDRVRDKEELSYIGLNEDEIIRGMDFPNNSLKSSYLKEEVFALVIRDYIELMILQGYELIVLVNGQGALNHRAILDRLAQEYSYKSDSKVINLMALVPTVLEDAGHATKMETSIQMYLNPESVDLSTLPDRSEKINMVDFGFLDSFEYVDHSGNDKSVVSDPRDSTEEYGKELVEKSIKELSKAVENLYTSIQTEKNKTKQERVQ